MKKYLFCMFASLPGLLAQAQDNLVIKGTKQIKEQQTPQQVLDSLHSRFPNAEAVRYYEGSSDMANKGWAITKEDNLSHSEEVNYYTISFKRDGLNYYGLYDKNGKLLESKMEQRVEELPEAVTNAVQSISQKYPGYKVVNKTYFHDMNYAKKKEYYEIVAQNGNSKKTFYYAPDGKLIKTKG